MAPASAPAPPPTPAPTPASRPTIGLHVDGVAVEVADPTDTLLGVLRDQLKLRSPKDGCSPQGQCGCCTVLVDGQPRVACVTPVRRVAGRHVTTLDGLDPERRQAWADAFSSTGASQCGFCTPGIIVRLDALHARSDHDGAAAADVAHPEVRKALRAHLCRCTGWQTIVEAWDQFAPTLTGADDTEADDDQGSAAAAARARLEGGTAQRVGTDVALGRGGFAADTAPDDALIAVADGSGGWAVGETLAEARALAGKVQGRRTTAEPTWPLEVPPGDWAATLRTTWVEPAYLETDASWCAPGGTPHSTVANGGAFGGKLASPVMAASRELADRHGRPVLALASREDATRWGPKRPPVAGGARPDGSGLVRVVATAGIAAAIASMAPGLQVEEVPVPGPPTSVSLRGAGWAEAVVLLAGARGEVGRVHAPNGAAAEAELVDGVIRAIVRCGPVLNETVLRSYCIGAAHMAWSWLTSEALSVDDDGEVHDLTVRSFGITRAIDTPPIEITIEPDESSEPVNGSDAVFAAVAAATWLAAGRPSLWPIGTTW